MLAAGHSVVFLICLLSALERKRDCDLVQFQWFSGAFRCFSGGFWCFPGGVSCFSGGLLCLSGGFWWFSTRATVRRTRFVIMGQHQNLPILTI